MNPTLKHVLATTVVLVLCAAGALAIFIGSGAYNFAADVPHTAFVRSLLETMRERSIDTRVTAIKVPAINDEATIIRGAGNYDAMCAQCHRAPGMAETELSKGLYPTPPNLSKEAPGAAHAFWVIKHGIKASGMPAWGKSMSDRDIWDMTGFLQALPKLDQAKYQAMVAKSSGHSHGSSPSKESAHDPSSEKAKKPTDLDHESSPHAHRSEGER